ncbi:hypothetical protein [Myxococcus sp. RHSTA-1-4]|uniref:hypothetical protein n=1 Tax=Myxococcus sp. RHSTA-1-4 TaxID=2874601 RepID=UPI001CBD01A9|nr:hypothetical protein [Myxococcus sp. RHSTA-1-4]MBZ4415275.1 hypothetical protein [Myxococcus sp. RHSTA-1-4]
MFKGISDASQGIRGDHNQQQSIRGDNNQQAAGDVVNKTVNHNETINLLVMPEQSLVRLPSQMAAAAVRLSMAIDASPEPSPHDFRTYDIEQKLSYNSVEAYRAWIDDYGAYGYAVDAAYDALDEQSPGARSKILRHIRAKYVRVRTELASLAPRGTGVMEIVRENSDKILELVSREIGSEIRDSPVPGMFVEDVEFPANAITCHAFINCKILERPSP